ncbi:hypothetical protein ACIQCR_20280 [Streptomyces sp. NPDC093249]
MSNDTGWVRRQDLGRGGVPDTGWGIAERPQRGRDTGWGITGR